MQLRFYYFLAHCVALRFAMPPQTLDPEQIMALRRLLATGSDPHSLAALLQISDAAVEALGAGRPWRALLKPSAIGDLFDDG
jgi:hypothetical protein